MTEKIHPSRLLLLLITLLTGVCPQRLREVYVKAGEMVALHCPHLRGYHHGDAKLIWTSHTTEDMGLTTSTSSVEQRQTDVLVHGRSLVILRASVNHQRNYSCSPGNASRPLWFRLMVYTTQTREYDERTMYSMTCDTQESCTLKCPDVNIPAVNTLNITSNGTIWHKEGESSPKAGYFSSVEERDQGVYTCTRSYLYQDQIYNMSFTVVLDVQPKKKLKKCSIITSPRMNDVYNVDLGSTVVIDCEAVLHSGFDEVFWLSGETFVDTDDSLPVFYNYSLESNSEGIMMTASLVFKKVSEDDLSKHYTCKLESSSEPSTFVTITLAQKASPFSSLTLGIVIIMVVIAVKVVVLDITLFLRDTLVCYCRTSDAKRCDAFLLCYKSDTDPGLSEHERKRLMSVLEERFGYSLCLYDRDVLPGEAVAEAVLDCIEESQTVVLVPTTSDHCPGSGLLSTIHAALVDRETRLIVIKTEAAEEPRSGSVPEALQLLAEAGDCVTWKGTSSMSPSSSFWKQLRYYLPAPQHASKINFLPQTATQDDNC